jgi:hypothetical protein
MSSPCIYDTLVSPLESTKKKRKHGRAWIGRFFFLLILLCTRMWQTHAQLGSSSHSVTITVQEVTVVQTNVGNISMQVTALDIVAGEDIMTKTNQASALSWGTNGSDRKISVSTNLAAPLFLLKMQAIDPSDGTAAPELTLSTTPTDFMLDVGRGSGVCTIKYTGVATAEQGFGTDSHLVTFTVQSQ